MPIRMLRDWTDSEKVNQLSAAGERFFTRLIMKCDDFGCFPGDERILRTSLFPFLIDQVSNKNILQWIEECWTEGLITKYEVDGKKYLQINEFGQRMDRARIKYPHPIPQLAGENPPPPGLSRLNTNTNTKPNTKPKNDLSPVDETSPAPDPDFLKFQTFIEKNAPAVGKMESPFNQAQFLEIKKKFTKEAIRDMILRMGNYKPLTRKNKSAYLTFINWSKNGFSNSLQTAAATISNKGAAAAETVKQIKSSTKPADNGSTEQQ